MIRVAPDTDAGRLLMLVAAGGGLLDIGELADRFDSPPKLGSVAAYPDWRRQMRAWNEAAGWRRAYVSRLLGRLREAGYVAPGSGAPRLEEGTLKPYTAADWRRRVAAWVACLDAEDEEVAAAGEWCDNHVAIVNRILGTYGPRALTVVEAVAADGKDGTGSEWRAYADLCRLEVVIPPRRARVTWEGQLLLDRWEGGRL